MRNFILCILVALLWPVVASATVIEFNSDGTVTSYEASDYLAKSRRLRMKPQVSLLNENSQPKGIFSQYIEAASSRYEVDNNLIHAVIEQESHYKPDALSPKGAQGLMQLMPDTARQYGVTDAFDPEQNINGGTKYLRYLLKRYNGDIYLALAAYNAGEGAVDRYGGVPPYPETKNYIEKIVMNVNKIR